MEEDDIIEVQVPAEDHAEAEPIFVPRPEAVLSQEYIQQLINTCPVRDKGLRGRVGPCLGVCRVRNTCLAQPGAVGAPAAYVAAAAVATVAAEPMDELTQRTLTHARACLSRHLWGCILYTGDYGTGKTHSANRVAAELEQHGGWVTRWLSCSTIDTDLRAIYGQQERTVDQLMRPYIDAPFLVIDGYGDHNTLRKHAAEVLEAIMLARYDAGRPVLLTTNLTLQQVRDTMQPATFDRIRQRGLHLVFDGASRRPDVQ